MIEQDELYDRAVMVVRARRRASLSLVQRTFAIGYNRTARLFEAMERAGVVSPLDASGNRTVLDEARAASSRAQRTTNNKD